MHYKTRAKPWFSFVLDGFVVISNQPNARYGHGSFKINVAHSIHLFQILNLVLQIHVVFLTLYSHEH